MSRSSLILCLLVIGCWTPSFPHEQRLLGIEFDKWLHFNTSALLSVAATQLERKWGWEDALHLLPIGCVLSANLAKEAFDTTQPGGRWDWKDVQTGILGGLFGIGLTKLWSVKGTSPLPDRSPGFALLLSILLPGGGHFYNGTPEKGWAYLGLEAAAIFPLFVTTPSDSSPTYYGAAGLFALAKIIDILDAFLTTAHSSNPALSVEISPGRVQGTLRF